MPRCYVFLVEYCSLAGFLFFGTITHVEETIRTLVEGPAWQRAPMRFLVLDLSLVAGVDMSAAEAFVRVQRLLAAKTVVLVFCGFSVQSPVGRALDGAGLLEEEGVELFGTFNDALECQFLVCEEVCRSSLTPQLHRDRECLPENVVHFSKGRAACRRWVSTCFDC